MTSVRSAMMKNRMCGEREPWSGAAPQASGQSGSTMDSSAQQHEGSSGYTGEPAGTTIGKNKEVEGLFSPRCVKLHQHGLMFLGHIIEVCISQLDHITESLHPPAQNRDHKHGEHQTSHERRTKKRKKQRAGKNESSSSSLFSPPYCSPHWWGRDESN